MLVSSLISRCHHGQTQGLFDLLSHAAIQGRKTVTQSPRRWAHADSQPVHRAQTQAQAHYHEAKVANIRNIGIIAHVDAGKTTTTERMLFCSGFSRHLGKVDHGDTITDFLPMERERGITIQSAAISFSWPTLENCPPGYEPKTINLIDTPGHQDFQYEVLRCMPVLDGAVCVMDAVKGVEAHTERVWAAAQQFRIPRVIFVNKLDRIGASFRKSVLAIASRLNAWPLVCQLPWWSGEDFVGVIDVIERVGYKWSSTGSKKTYPSHALEKSLGKDSWLAEDMRIAREELVEKLCDVDDDLTLEFAEFGAELSSKSIKRSIRKAVSDGNATVVPVLAGASLRNIGVEPLLDAVNDYLPSPQERPEVEIRVGDRMRNLTEAIHQEVERMQKKGHKLMRQPSVAVASVFKVTSDPYRGMLSFVRVYYGTLQRNSTMWNTNQQVKERALAMMQIIANKHQEIPHLTVGGIGALAGLKTAATGDTLVISPEASEGHILKALQIRPAVIPPAVTFISLEAFSPIQEKELEKALTNLSREDPSLRWTKDEKASQYILSGMGKLHLEVATHNLKKYKIDSLVFGTIQVDYKEALTKKSGPERYMIDRNVAGSLGKASCVVIIEPLGADDHDDRESWRERAARLGYPGLNAGEFYYTSTERAGNLINVNVVHPISDADKFDLNNVAQNLQNGAISALYRGPRRGFPLQNCRVEIIFDCEIDFFGTASSGHYLQAAAHAVRNVLKSAEKAGAIVILEPLMKVEITCPEAVTGAVRHDLAARHGGWVLETEDLNDVVEGGGQIDDSQVYAPRDPYESITSLRDPKKGSLRMLKLRARVPLKEMLNYDENLRSMTEGRHSIEMELDTFARVTGSREKIV